MDENNPVFENAMGLAEDDWLDALTPYKVAWEGGVPFLEPDDDDEEIS